MGRVSGEYAFDELRNWTIFDFFFTKPSKFPRLEARARARNFYSSIRLLLKLILYYIMHTPSLFLHTQSRMRFFLFASDCQERVITLILLWWFEVLPIRRELQGTQVFHSIWVVLKTWGSTASIKKVWTFVPWVICNSTLNSVHNYSGFSMRAHKSRQLFL